MKKKYYNIERLLNTKAQYLMLLGERANGKSYQVKLTCLQDAWKAIKNDATTEGQQLPLGGFVYLRRWGMDIKPSQVESYFGDMPINKITGGNFDYILAHRGYIHFAKYDDDEGKVIKSIPVGRYCALNESERYKSNTFVGYDKIIYEEFITNQLYLTDEPNQLQHFVSTVFRDRAGQVFLVGNTLSRVCPYFSEWCLDNVLKQKQGEIDIYHFSTLDGGQIDIAVEYCESSQSGNNKMFFGQSEKNIVGGIWETREVAKLPRKLSEYEKVYELLLEYQKFRFCVQLLFEPTQGGFVVYVYPYTKTRGVERVISDVIDDNPYRTANLRTDNKCEALINTCVREGKIFYSDNLTGADFTAVNENFKIGQISVKFK